MVPTDLFGCVNVNGIPSAAHPARARSAMSSALAYLDTMEGSG
jgi:hypothetical protein